VCICVIVSFICDIKHTPSMARSFFPHCYLFSCIMYCLRLAREDTRGAWWYLLLAC
jgi:hypothetical protein